jgi:hypothetical protein
MSDIELMTIVRRVRLEYERMPGLALTIPQAARLLRLDPDQVETVMAALVDAEYLRLGRSGFVRRAPERRERDRRAAAAQA